MKKAFLMSAISLVFLGSQIAGAQMKPSAEQRQKMAEQHDKMAACLRSTKSVAECHKEMMQNCEATMGKEFCPMGDHHMMKKMHREGK